MSEWRIGTVEPIESKVREGFGRKAFVATLGAEIDDSIAAGDHR